MQLPSELYPTIGELIKLSERCGMAIMEIYAKSSSEQGIFLKSDQSPITQADKDSNEILLEGLHQIHPGIPFISEEEKAIPYSERKNWDYFWLLDPLDGTKEFIKGNGNFTVNISLIHKNEAVLGMIHLPVRRKTYVGIPGEDAYVMIEGEKKNLKRDEKKDQLTALASWIKQGSRELEVLSQYPIKKTIALGSAVKFCMIAEGQGDIYYRSGPTMEWDTAAGQAIVEAAGGKVLAENLQDPLLYNKESLLNGPFLVRGF